MLQDAKSEANNDRKPGRNYDVIYNFFNRKSIEILLKNSSFFLKLPDLFVKLMVSFYGSEGAIVVCFLCEE